MPPMLPHLLLPVNSAQNSLILNINSLTRTKAAQNAATFFENHSAANFPNPTTYKTLTQANVDHAKCCEYWDCGSQNDWIMMMMN